MPNSPEPPTDLSPDTLVCAYYERESSWHRGIVEKITEKRGKKMVGPCSPWYKWSFDCMVDDFRLLFVFLIMEIQKKYALI